MDSEYDPRPADRYRSFAGTNAPYNWPQDTLRVPNGHGALPRVNALNAEMTRREGFGMSWTFANVAAGAKTQIINNTPDDGDFWLDSISVQAYSADNQTQLFFNSLPPAYFQVQDVASGFELFHDVTLGLGNGIPASLLTIPIGGQGAAGAPMGAGVRNSMMQPYCFLRGCAIKVTITSPVYATGQPAINWYMNMNGWKEYAYAAA